MGLIWMLISERRLCRTCTSVRTPDINRGKERGERKRAGFYYFWGVYWRNAGPLISNSVQLVCISAHVWFDIAILSVNVKPFVSHDGTLTQTTTEVLTSPSALHQQISGKSASCSLCQQFQNQFISSSLSIQMAPGHESTLLCHSWPQIWNRLAACR